MLRFRPEYKSIAFEMPYQIIKNLIFGFLKFQFILLTKNYLSTVLTSMYSYSAKYE